MFMIKCNKNTYLHHKDERQITLFLLQTAYSTKQIKNFTILYHFLLLDHEPRSLGNELLTAMPALFVALAQTFFTLLEVCFRLDRVDMGE